MVNPAFEWEREREPGERTSGVYATVSRTTAAASLAELREITGEHHVAILLSPSEGAPPTAAAYPRLARSTDSGYSLAHRLSSWLHGITRGTLVEVPAYVRAWFPQPKVIVVPACTPAWVAARIVTSPACAVHAVALRSFAADLAVRLELADRRSRLDALGREPVSLLK